MEQTSSHCLAHAKDTPISFFSPKFQTLAICSSFCHCIKQDKANTCPSGVVSLSVISFKLYSNCPDGKVQITSRREGKCTVPWYQCCIRA